MQITVPGSDSLTIKQYLANFYGYDLGFIGPVVGILFGFIIFFAGLAILCLMFVNYQRR